MSTIPASAIVNVNPQVLSAAGSALNLSALILTTSTRVPIGSILSFPTDTAVNAYFGDGAVEDIIADDYFLGFDNSNAKPGAILFAQYNPTAVPGYIRSGSLSAMTLTQLQALTGTLTLTVNGVAVTSGTINLSGATSFSNAATLITTGFGYFDAVTSNATTIAAGTATNSTAASITGNILTVGAVVTGAFVVGGVLSGTGVTTGTAIVKQLTGTPGGVGTYQVSAIQNVATTTITQSYGLMTVAAVASGTLAVGQVISGGTTAVGSTITAQASGTAGGAGTYVISGGAQTVSAAVISAGPLICTFDSILSSFVITGGTPGTVSTMSYATGTLSASLFLTQVTGATLSQGAAASTPAATMNAIIAQVQNWATFMTAQDPDLGYGNTQKQAFAAWVNSQNNRYAYVAWDTDITPTTSATATSSLGNILAAANSSGTIPMYAPDYNLAAAMCGAIASIDFTQTNGRATLAFKSQSGQVPSVTTQLAASNLIANGYNYYGAYATATQPFNFFYPGSVTGAFKWIDSYVNQIWMNAGLQSDVMNYLKSAYSVPYNAAGYDGIRAACMNTINAAVNFGAIRAGVPLSAAQIAQVNAAAGTPIDQVLSSQGWYLQIVPATAATRSARTSPPINFWYMDGGSIHQISLASIEVQ
jgi:hypothetical protein